METTARDALMAEILGDVGKLTEAVERLKTTLPEQTEACSGRLTEIVETLEKSGEIWRQKIDGYVETRADTAMQAVEREGAQIIDAMEATLIERVSAVEQSMVKLIKSEISAPVQKSLAAQSAGRRKTIVLSILASAISSTLLIGAHFGWQKMDDNKYVDLGKATAAQWNFLDQKSKTIIQRGMSR